MCRSTWSPSNRLWARANANPKQSTIRDQYMIGCKQIFTAMVAVAIANGRLNDNSAKVPRRRSRHQ